MLDLERTAHGLIDLGLGVGFTPGGRLPGDGEDGQGYFQFWPDNLHGLLIDQGEGRAQAFMAADDGVDAALQCRHIQPPPQAHNHGNVVKRAVWL